MNQVDSHSLKFIVDNIGYHADVILDINEILQEREEIDDLIDKDLNRIAIATHELKIALETAQAETSEWSNLCHTIRTPISNIKGYGELLIEELTDRFSKLPTSFSYLHDILASATYILELVESIDPTQEQSVPIGTGRKFSGSVNAQIVITDGDPISQQILSRRLLRDGYKVSLAHDIEAAVRSFSLSKIAMIIVRLDSLSSSDQTLISSIRRDNPNLVILVISHCSDIQLVIRCMESGVDDFLRAPINAVLLRTKIQLALNNQMLRHQQKQYWQVLNQAIQSIEHGFALYDDKWQLQLANKGFYRLYEKALKSGQAVDVQQFIKANTTNHSEPGMSELNSAGQQSVIHQLPDKRWMEIAYSSMPDGGIVTIHKDVTERKERQERWKNMALTDPLTGLANRTLLREIIENALKEKQSFALLYCDLDAFKPANDYWGHEFGDFILKQLAIRMKDIFRDSDTVARVGGDEFVIMCNVADSNVIMCNVADSDLAYRKGTQLLKAIREPFVDGDKSVSIDASIGISLFPLHGITYDRLLDKADQAMYEAKRNGKGRMVVYS